MLNIVSFGEFNECCWVGFFVTVYRFIIVDCFRFHTFYNPPKNEDVRDRCRQHPKDREESVKKMLDEYYSFSDELAEYYADEGVRKCWLGNVMSVGSVIEVGPNLLTGKKTPVLKYF